MADNTKIAGLKTVNDWRILRSNLQSAPSTRKWQEAYDEFLFERVKTRYLEPIEAISNISKKQGKGFSVVAICCSLIEFFEALKKGYEFRESSRNYYNIAGDIVRSAYRFDRYQNPYPISNKEIFVHFLTENPPFSEEFTIQLAESFYDYVRCAILHQAQTGANWLIKDGEITGKILNIELTGEILLKWMPFQKAFFKYLDKTYQRQLLTDQDTQNNFIFKWDKICNI